MPNPAAEVTFQAQRCCARAILPSNAESATRHDRLTGTRNPTGRRVAARYRAALPSVACMGSLSVGRRRPRAGRGLGEPPLCRPPCSSKTAEGSPGWIVGLGR
jgi:hypothetical protein